MSDAKPNISALLLQKVNELRQAAQRLEAVEQRAAAIARELQTLQTATLDARKDERTGPCLH